MRPSNEGDGDDGHTQDGGIDKWLAEMVDHQAQHISILLDILRWQQRQASGRKQQWPLMSALPHGQKDYNLGPSLPIATLVQG